MFPLQSQPLCGKSVLHKVEVLFIVFRRSVQMHKIERLEITCAMKSTDKPSYTRSDLFKLDLNMGGKMLRDLGDLIQKQIFSGMDLTNFLVLGESDPVGFQYGK